MEEFVPKIQAELFYDLSIVANLAMKDIRLPNKITFSTKTYLFYILNKK